MGGTSFDWNTGYRRLNSPESTSRSRFVWKSWWIRLWRETVRTALRTVETSSYTYFAAFRRRSRSLCKLFSVLVSWP